MNKPRYDCRTVESIEFQVRIKECVYPSSSRFIEEEIEIPTINVSDMGNCSIISMEYKLEIHAVTGVLHSDLIANVPIIIGTIPINTNCNDKEVLNNEKFS